MPLPNTYLTAGVVTSSADRVNLVNVLWYQPDYTVAAPDGASVVQEFATALNAVLGPLYKAFLATDARYAGVNCRLVIGGVSNTASAIGGAGVGLISSDSLPDYAAALIRKSTLQGGKSGRGRWFVGPVPETVTDGGRLTGGGLANLQAIADALYNAVTITGGDWVPKHYSRKLDTLLTIEGANAQAILATQRRRRLRPTLV